MDLVNTLAAVRRGRAIADAVREGVHEVREFRNSLVHELTDPAPPVALVEAPPGDDDWYLNVLWIDRRKWLLITHAGSRFSVLVADVRVAALRPPGPLVVGAIVAALRDEGLPASALGPLDPADVQIAATASRSVLGSMTDIAWRVEHLLPVGQTAPGVVLGIQRALQRTPTGSIGWSYPITTRTGMPGGRFVNRAKFEDRARTGGCGLRHRPERRGGPRRGSSEGARADLDRSRGSAGADLHRRAPADGDRQRHARRPQGAAPRGRTGRARARSRLE